MNAPSKQQIGFYLLGTLCLCIPALINNFPFIYSDTGTYIGTGFSGGISEVRPAMYGYFLRHTSMKESFWFTILAQAILTIYVIRAFIRYMFPSLSYFQSLLIIAVLTLSTSIGINTGLLMPDFTSSFLLLITALLLYSVDIRKIDFILLSILLWFTIASHHSHAFIMLGTLMLLVIIHLLKKQHNISWLKRIGLVATITLIGYLTIPVQNYLRMGEYFHSKAQNIFLLNRIHQMGLLDPFLSENCKEASYSICQYKDSIPRDILWSRSSPVYKDEGWNANNEAYGEIVGDFLTSPYYLKRFITKTFETAIQQFFSFKTVKLDKVKKGKWPHFIFEQYMPDTLPSLENAAQNTDRWSNNTLDKLQYLIVFSSFLFLSYHFFFQQHSNPTYRNITLLLLIGLLSNAFICGGISMIAPRFQSRIIWVIPLFALCLILQDWQKYQK